MPDREKVIKGLECCVEKLDTVVNKSHGFNCIVCPYFRKCDRSGYFIGLPLMRDALALLKAQEPREPHYTKLEYIVNGMPVAINHPECPRCYDNGLVLWDAAIEEGAAYCKRCGQAVKWE
jgi:hypothetical protein